MPMCHIESMRLIETTTCKVQAWCEGLKDIQAVDGRSDGLRNSRRMGFRSTCVRRSNQELGLSYTRSDAICNRFGFGRDKLGEVLVLVLLHCRSRSSES